MLVSGEDVYRYLKYEAGVHRVQRVPATEKSGRIHTSTVTVAVLPQPEEVQSEDTLITWHYGVYNCITVLWGFSIRSTMFRPLLRQTLLEFPEVYIVLNYYCFIFAEVRCFLGLRKHFCSLVLDL